MKKASILDIFIWMIIGFVVILFFAVFQYGWGLFNDELISIDVQLTDNPAGQYSNFSEIAKATSGKFTLGLEQLQYIAIAMIFGMIIMMFVSNFVARGYPFFFVAYVFVVIIAVVVSVYISNTYEEILLDSPLTATLTGYTAPTYIMLNLPIFVAVVGIIGAVFLSINYPFEEGGLG